MKAMLLNKCNEFCNEHSLVKLVDFIEKQNVQLNYGRNHEDTIRVLDGFYELRYPRTVDPIEIGDDDWERIENLFEFLVLMLPKKIQKELKKMSHSSKGNRILMRRKKSI